MAISQLQANYEEVTHAPFTDGLTGVFNHGFFHISLEREMGKGARYEVTFTLAFIDIDWFSNFNKQHGSVEGDRNLREVATAIKENIRQTDLVARYSSDVFAVILMKSDVEVVTRVAERIRNAVEKRSSGNLTVSIGLAAFPRDAKNKEDLIREAGEALSYAKLRGKNRISSARKKERVVSGEKAKILVVDDEPANLQVLENLFVSSNYEVYKAENGRDALYLARKAGVDLIILDVLMPDMNGFEVCRRLKENEALRLIPVIMITGMSDTGARIKGIDAGADDFIGKPFNMVELMARTKSLIKVKALNDNLIDFENVLISLANVIEAKDAYTEGHTQRVANMAGMLARKMGLSTQETKAIRLGGILHDIGKIGVADSVLNKPGALTPEEWESIKLHPKTGYNICLPLKKMLGSALDVIRHHHEKLDGTGYPDGLKGKELSLSSRIMAVVDIYDALVTDRSYRKGMPKEKALKIISHEADEGKLDKEVIRNLTEAVGG